MAGTVGDMEKSLWVKPELVCHGDVRMITRMGSHPGGGPDALSQKDRKYLWPWMSCYRQYSSEIL